MIEAIALTSKLVKDPRDLAVFKRAYKVSLDIHKTSLKFPNIEQFELARQIRKASKSVCANISEGFAKQTYSRAEFGRFLAIAEGSTIEVKTWLQYCVDLEYISQITFNKWDEEYNIVKSMLYKLRKSL